VLAFELIDGRGNHGPSATRSQHPQQRKEVFVFILVM
jgi:hypothetical protein